MASKAGPIPLPTGCVPSVMTTFTLSPTALPTISIWFFSFCAISSLLTFAVSPTGISITTWVEPAADFFDSTEAMSCPSLSISKAFSILISTSSAGLNCAVPPQTKQPPSFSTTAVISSEESVTLVRTSIVSAVPAGEVMAREDVFGIVSP